MSLFRLREWWQFQPGDDVSQCSPGGLCIAKISDRSNRDDVFVVGTFSGLLRIFDISIGGNGTNDDAGLNAPSIGGFKAEHMLLEKQLDYPILQLTAGHYVSSNEKQHLAVLHPRKLAVYSFGKIGAGQVEHGNQYGLTLIYEHYLQRTAYNMVDGPFGHVSGRDFFCIQSIDGTLSIYEQENYAFTRFLPGSLLPGPLAYIRKTDSFLTVSSQWQVEAYKYQVLAVAADAKSKEDAEKTTSGKRVGMDWSFRLGEMAFCVQAVEISPAPISIFVLGERAVYCLTESGQLRYMRKLDYEPSCLYVYGATSEGFIQFLIASHTNTLLFYSDTVLKWAAQAPFTSVAVRTASFGMTRSMLVALSDNGSLLCSYLGTDPALYGIPMMDRSSMNYSAKQNELRRLQGIIKSSKNDINLQRKDGAVEDLRLTFHIPQKPDGSSLGYDGVDTGNASITVKAVINVSQPLENVRIFVSPPSAISAHVTIFSRPFLRNKEELQITFSTKGTVSPAHLRVTFHASYNLPGAGGKTHRTSTQLPLTLVAKPCDPVKSAAHKITIDSNKPLVNLNELFPEFVSPGASIPLQSMGFHLQVNKAPQVAILASKQSHKYRVQSDTFEQIPMFLHELVWRLNRHYSSDGGIQLSFAGPLPFTEYFALIDQHFEIYRKKMKLKEFLAQKAAQFRAAERQLLMKLNETVPSQMAHVDALIEMTYRQIISTASNVQELDEALRMARSTLVACTHLLLTLIQLHYQLGPSERQTLENVFYIDSDEASDQAWEEHVDAALVYVLQSMSKSGSTTAASTTSGLQQLADITRLKKHMVLLTEKLAKGAKLPPMGKRQRDENNQTKNAKGTGAGKTPAVRPALESTSEDTNWRDVTANRQSEADVPVGSTFGKLPENQHQPTASSLPPLSGPTDTSANDNEEFRSSTSMSKREEGGEMAFESNQKGDQSGRVRSAARTRSRSAGKRRSLVAADSTGQLEDQGAGALYERKRTAQRIGTAKDQRIESEAFNDKDDDANGFF